MWFSSTFELHFVNKAPYPYCSLCRHLLWFQSWQKRETLPFSRTMSFERNWLVHTFCACSTIPLEQIIFPRSWGSLLYVHFSLGNISSFHAHTSDYFEFEYYIFIGNSSLIPFPSYFWHFTIIYVCIYLHFFRLITQCVHKGDIHDFLGKLIILHP